MIEVMRILSAAAPASGAIFVDDVFFKSGRPWFDARAYGAVGDGVTDDTTAINAALTDAINIGSGTVFLSQGKTSVNIYQVSGVLNVTNGVTLMGTNPNTTIRASGDNQVITMAGRYAAIVNLTIIGSKTVGAIKDAVTIQNTASGALIDNCKVSGGRYALYSVGDSLVMRSTFDHSYGDAAVYSTGGYYWRNAIDQSWPANTPSAPLTINAWQANTAYTANTVVSTQGYNIQVMAGGAGTSGGSAPTIQPYGVNITDGTVTWHLVGPTTYSGMKLDGASFAEIRDCDFTGSYTSGILVNNGNSIFIENPTVGATINEGIKVWGSSGSGNNSNGIHIAAGQISGLLSSTGKAIWLYVGNPGYTRDISISGMLIFGCPYGVYGSGPETLANWVIGPGNKISLATTAAVHIDGGVTDFAIIGNALGSSSQHGANAIGIELGAGTSDFFTIADNVLDGATTKLSDSSTGTNKKIIGNPGFPTLSGPEPLQRRARFLRLRERGTTRALRFLEPC